MSCISLFWLIATGLAITSAQDQCQNMWQANFLDPNLKLCDVLTDGPSKCAFPFTYNGASHDHCILVNNQPSCKDESGQMRKCMVPTDAVIYGVTTRKGGSFWQNGASFKGGTLVWITGTRFAEETFSTSPSSSTNNVVYFTNEFSSYLCDIHPDGTTTTQITCYTPEMPIGTYLVQVQVKGEFIPFYQYENQNNAKIQVSSGNTPRIDLIKPYSGLPGTFVEVRGDFKTSCYLRDVDGCADDSGARITRLYIGGQQCQMINTTSNELFQEVTENLIKCKVENVEVGYFRASMLVSNQYGRALTSLGISYVSPDENIYNFQTYAEIDSISPQTGSVEGGTRITIIGKNLYHDNNVPAQIEIAGKPCRVVDFDMSNLMETRIVCESSPSVATTDENYGNRGITLITENVATDTNSFATATPSGAAMERILQKTEISGEGDSGAVTVWMKGFMYPKVNSSYQFTLNTNGQAKLFISTDANSANKVEVSNNGKVDLLQDTYYYFLAVGSRNSGNLDLKVTAKMMQTSLTEEKSSFIKNEVQAIDITSTSIPEAYTITLSPNTTLNATGGTGVVQSVLIKSLGYNAPFTLRLYGTETVHINYGATALEVEAALNDLPFLYPNMVQVSESLAQDGVTKNYTVTFNDNLGDVPLLEEANNYVNATIIKVSGANGLGSKSHIMIYDKPSSLFNPYEDSANDIESVIDESFGIRCPNSIQKNNASESFETFDYEGCSWGDKMLNETAFCGKCASSNTNSFFRNLNVSLSYNFLCFAYKISVPTSYLQMQVVDPLFRTLSTTSIRITLKADNRWHYDCIDIKKGWMDANPDSSYSFSNIKVYSAGLYPANGLVDVVSIRKRLPFGFTPGSEDEAKLTARRVIPTIQYQSGSLSVTKNDGISIDFSFRPTNCSYNLDLFTLINSYTTDAPTIAKSSSASPPVTGNFDLAWNGQTLSNIASNIDEYALSALFQSIPSFGNAQVTVSRRDCSGYKWSVKWLSGGDKPAFTIASNNLLGSNVALNVNGIQDGGVLFSPIQADFMRTYHNKPQVSVLINGISTACSNCSFEWSQDATPVVNSIDASSNSRIVIDGTGFNETASQNIVLIGNVSCNVTSATTTQLICSAGLNPVGTYSFTVNVLGKGLATMNSNTQATFALAATSINPTSGSTGGGNMLKIEGTGFSSQSTVTVDGNNCQIKEITYFTITCIVPPNNTPSNKQVDVVVTDTMTSSLSAAYLYDFDSTPVITSIMPNILSVEGGQIVVLTGTNLPSVATNVKFGTFDVSIISSNSTNLVLRSPALRPGSYDLNFHLNSSGLARVSQKIEYKLYVTSFTPNIGSIRGGTLVDVYGEGFDSTACDNNMVSFGNQRCQVRNCSSTWIKCKTSDAFVTHQVTNEGSDPYHGKGYAWSSPFLTINVGDSVNWSWKPPTGISSVSYRVIQVQDAISFQPIGFDSGDATAVGSFMYQFNQAGTYHYWSGYVESSKQIIFRGSIEVVDSVDKELDLNVKLNGYSAQKCIFPFTYMGMEYSACTNQDEAFNWCSPSAVFNGQKLKCDPLETAPLDPCPGSSFDANTCGVTAPTNLYSMLFTGCQNSMTSITSVSVTNSTYDADIIISGSGFSNNQCENKVMVGSVQCALISSSTTELTCRIGANSGLYPNYPYAVDVLVANQGYASVTNTFELRFVPKINSFNPNIGSVAGGTKIIIEGDGFLPAATVVNIGPYPFYAGNNAKINGSTIEINTVFPPGTEGLFNVSVIVNKIHAVCTGDCSFRVSDAISPVLSSVSPSRINDTSDIYLVGSMFGSVVSDVMVTIGGVNCNIFQLNDTNIGCSVSAIHVGDQEVNVNVKGVGNAKKSANHVVTGILNIKSVIPDIGSVHGGLLVEIQGNGFDMNTRVAIGSFPCFVERATAGSLFCRTTDSTQTPMAFQAPATTTRLTTTTRPTTTTLQNVCLTKYLNGMLASHNSYRALHNTSELSLSVTITGTAQAYAEHLAENRLFEHSSGTGYGENLAKSWSNEDIYSPSTDCEAFGAFFTKLWYDEIAHYDYGNPGQKKAGSESEMIGHFTQVVWKDSTQLGCGIAKGSDNFVYGVCNYSPPGNYIGASNYAANVLPLGGGASKRRRRSVVEGKIVLNSYGNEFASTSAFSYSNAATPTVSSVSPSEGIGGTVTLAGSGFGTDLARIRVKVGEAICNLTAVTDTEIVCELGPHSAGSHAIVVERFDQGYSNSNIKYTYSLTVSNLSTNEGSIGGGLELILTGSGFSKDSSVTICNKPCRHLNSSFNSFTCQVPKADDQNQDSSCTVSISENGMTATSSFSYRLSLTPRLTSVSPMRGGTGGGTLLTISGTGFPTNQDLIRVTIGGSICIIASVSETQITCRTEPYRKSSAILNVDVDMIGKGLAFNDGSVQFEYIDLWSSKYTWGGFEPPAAGEIAVISYGQHIYFDAASTPVLKGLIIQGGSLIFEDSQDVALNVEYVIILAGGKFQVGTESAPFKHKAVITMHGHVRSQELPTYGAKVIALRNGTLDMHGMHVGVTWTKLESNAVVGATEIVLQEPVIWPVGSEIVVATTGDKFSPGESEIRFITGKSNGNKTLILNKPLEFGHLGEDRTVGSNGDFQTVSLRAEVGLLSRNVKFQGWNDDTWNRWKTTEGCPAGFNPAEFAVQTCFLGRYGPELGSDEFGGIIFIFAGQNQPKNVETVVARFSNVELFHVGQSFKKGRYPIHFHMNGDMPSSYVKECAIHESFNRAINIHASNYLKLTRNVIYNIMGGAYFLEDGVEIGNEFLYNLAVFVRTSSSLLNEDVTPAAFWATNPNNTYLHNAVAGSTHFGWWYRILDRPEGPSFTNNYCPKKIPFGRHFNNSVHSTGRFGLWVFPGYTPTVSGACSDSRPSVAKFEKFVSWSNDKGGEFVNSNNIQFHDFTIWDQFDTGVDVKIIAGNSATNTGFKNIFDDESLTAMISDSVIIGNSIQGQNSVAGRGLTWAWDRGEIVKNVKFYNFPTATAMDVTAIAGTCTFGCGGWIGKVKGLSFNNVKYRHSQRWPWDNVLLDLDGSLTGQAGDMVVFKDGFFTDDARCRDTSDFRNGVACSNVNTPIRFAFNNYDPSGAFAFNLINKDGKNVSSPKLGKRLTHKPGMMVHLEAKNEYTGFFENAERVTNMSYSSVYYNLKPGDYIIMKHPLKKRPDQIKINGRLQTESASVLDVNVNNNGDWYWENSTSSVAYIIKNSDTLPFLDVSVGFSAIVCRYVGCKPPENPAERAPIAKRPDNVFFWSNRGTWGAQFFLNRRRRSAATGIPEDGDSILIPDGIYVVVDTPLPKFKILKIEGYLELDNAYNHDLVAEMIFINGGQLIIGWEDDPILTNVTITLTGEKKGLDFILPNGFEKIGGKGIGAYGGLDIHGKPRDVSWTKLAITASAGANTIELVQPVDWVVGEEILITTTSYILEHTETLVISAVSNDKRTLTLTSPLVYDHLAYSENLSDGSSYKIAAAVGLLTRNVKVMGEIYPNQQADLYGFRIIVSDYAAIVHDFPTYYKGFARIENCEFIRFGQFGRESGDDSKYGMLLSNLGQYNSSRASYIRNNAFHHGLGVAVGIFSSQGFPIENNVIHKTLDYAIRLEGKENIARGNLVAMHYWGSTFLTKSATEDKTYWGAIDIGSADSAIVEDNYVAGSERTGFHIRGDICDGKSMPDNLAHSIKNNTVYGAGNGVALSNGFSFPFSCVKISGFTVYKSQYYGIYYQGDPELVVENNDLIDNQVSVYTLVWGPAPTSHVNANKKVFLKNMMIMARSSLADCAKDIFPRNISDSLASYGTFKSGPTRGGRIGLVGPTFMVGSNGGGFGKKPFSKLMSYNQIGGQMIVSNITFVNFGTACGNRDAAVTNSATNDDGQHPLTLSNIQLHNVSNSSKVWFFRPNLGKINPSDCVDMDCDGMKKNLIRDLDGSFLGSPGAIISQSEFGWGSQQRGLGDFRIPKEMLAYPNGSFIDPSNVYNHPGIVRDESLCSYNSDWQAHECHGLEYRMLIIESMDHDTEDRRLSPVAILSDNGYLDLINGPQDHGWCFGYTCQKRVSTFMALVAANKSYDIVLTSTPPDTLRLQILNSDSSFKVRLSMHYSVQQRIDLYKDAIYQEPTNAIYVNGNMQLVKPEPLQKYKPTYQNATGTNVFMKWEQKIYFSADGSSIIDLKVAPVLFVSFGLPAITPEEFFNEATIVGNFALLLGVDASKIRRVEIVRASRRRRDTNSLNFVKIIIEENAQTDLNNTNAIDAQKKTFEKLDATISNLFITNQLQEKAQSLLNVTIASLAVQSPSSNETAKTVASRADIVVVRKASGCSAQIPCTTQPLLKIVDENGALITNMGNKAFPWIVVANMTSSSNPTAKLINEVEVAVSQGYATFTKLGISELTTFTLSFKFKSPEGINDTKFDPKEQLTPPITSSLPVLSCQQYESDITVAQNTNFNITVKIIDKVSKLKVENISWANYRWTSRVRLHELGYHKPTGALTVTNTTVTFDPTTGLASFQNLKITANGMYLLTFNVYTPDNTDYNFNCYSNAITVSTAIESYDPDLPPNYVIKFEGDYNSIEPSEVKANVYNFMSGYNVSVAGLSVNSGSVYISFYSDSSSSSLIDTLIATGLTVDPNLQYSYASINDQILNCTNCVIATSAADTTTTPGVPQETVIAIAVGSIVGGILGGIAAAFLVLVAFLGFKEFHKIKVRSTTITPDGIKSPAYVKAGKSKSRIEKLFESLTGTTKHSYHSNMKTPNVYDKSYLDEQFDDQPMPVIPQHQNIIDDPSLSKFGIKESLSKYGLNTKK